jgi:ABC-type lipoprotein release transport system permease subunit
MNGETQSRRGAVARILVWSGILVATAAFWVGVALGLAACIR